METRPLAVAEGLFVGQGAGEHYNNEALQATVEHKGGGGCVLYVHNVCVCTCSWKK